MAIKVSSGRLKTAPRILIHGNPKVGKTTAAADMEDPLFLSGEAGDGQLNVKRIEFAPGRYQPQTWAEVLSTPVEIAKDPSVCKTLVLDGFGAIEKLAAAHVCATNKWANISTPGYGKGEGALLAEVQKLIRLLEDVWSKGIGIAFVCHTTMGKVKRPDGSEYPRYAPALTSVNNADVAGLVVGWCDAVLFAEIEVEVAKTDKKAIAIGTGRHIVRTTSSDPQYVAGGRYDNVPPVMDLDMREWRRLVAEGQDPKAMSAKLSKLSEGLDEKTRESISKWLATPQANDAKALCQRVTWVTAKLAEMSEQAA